MFDKIFTYLNNSHPAFISFQQTMYNLVQHFEANYVSEGLKNAAIDEAVLVLQSYKTAPVPSTTGSTVAPITVSTTTGAN